jgi:hypothetical protein
MPTARNRRTILVCLAAVSTLVAAAATTSSAGTPRGGNSQRQTCPIPVLGADPDPVSLTGPSTLWSPKHRYVDYTLTASETAGEAGDGAPHGVTINYSVTVSDSRSGPAHPAQAADANPPTGNAQGDFRVPVHFQLRAQRAGNGGTRTYLIDWNATFDGGLHMCSSSGAGEHPFTVTVPHDRTH